MAVSKQPTITPETSSVEGLDEEISSRGEAKWKRFHPFRVVRKIFRRRIKSREGNSVTDASKKSWSTSELQSVQDDGARKREVTSPLKIGLSVSHDSIFSPENNANAVSGEALNIPHGSSLSVHHTTIKNMFKDELFTRVRARRDSDDDDDVGLPHSPCTSPTTVDVLTQGLKEKSSKSQTTCSAGSLISMGSSENDEDSAGQSSGHSSRMSLIDRRSLDSDGDTDLSQPVPLNHNAARHRIAVRPKRTYGLPRRRMNQIAAAKMSTLPSTPEVTEDYGKFFQKLDTIEVVKTFTELSASSNEVSTLKQSSEWQVSHMSSSFSYNEVSELSQESVIHNEKSAPESCTQIFKENFEDNSKVLSDEIIKRLSGDNLISKALENKTNFSLIENNVEFTSKNKSNYISNSKCNFLDNLQADIAIENSKIIRDDGCLETTQLTLIETQNSQEESLAPLKVSSLVRNLENSESFKNSEKLYKVKENTFSRNTNNDSHFTLQMKENSDTLVDNNDKTSNCEIMKDLIPKNHFEKNNEPLTIDASSNQDCNRKNQSSQEYNKEIKTVNVHDKLDIDSEFVLKPLKRDVSLETNSELTFQDLTIEKESTLISSLNSEEESIMSSKSLSIGVEESGIFVSHHASIKNDLKSLMVTEAHNFAAVEENVGVFIQASGDIHVDKDSCEPWISSVDIPSSTKLDSDVTVNSSTSTLCNDKIKDEKITISVNSKLENVKSRIPSNEKEDLKRNLPDLQKYSPLPKHDINQQPTLKEKQPSNIIHKSHAHETNSNGTNMKNSNTQKRVSVEIVPFSQRMKERKYQPISFANKEPSSDQCKNSNAVIERKLSDRKVSAKNKESDKSNSRHSFSGSFISDGKKGESVIEKKSVKSEKVQYPVQIRIHKSVPKPDIKDKKINTTTSNKESKNSTNKSSNDVKFQMQATKVNQSDTKLLKEDNATKWEVKIQPSVSHCNNSQFTESDENYSSLIPETSLVTRNEPQKATQAKTESSEFQTHQEMESPQVKTQDNSWRTPKESPTTLSDDPEPELLRVFARRSIKQKHCDKGKVEESQENTSSDVSLDDSSHKRKNEDNNEISVSDNSTVIKISEISKPHITKHELKKKSKSFCEKEKIQRSVSPLKEMNLIHRESLTKVAAESSFSSETIHPRQRLASVPDIPVNLPPDCKNSQKMPGTESSPASSMKEEIAPRTTSTAIPVPSPSGPINGNLTSIGMVKDSQEILNDKEPHAPSWLQLAQQRRELREQRERLLLGGSPNSFLDASNKPSRSSKVWDMVNNFQKLQMT